MSSQTLEVLLGERAVGTLEWQQGGKIRFSLHESYLAAAEKPVLGQVFEEDPGRAHTSRTRLPPWFSNLLPEGPLRALIAERAGVKSVREFFLLHALGLDLPGAVVVRGDPAPPHDVGPRRGAVSEEHRQLRLHFSLAGIQLKFSLLGSSTKLTLPARGEAGDVIVKLPSAQHWRLPEVEYATMEWARAAGLSVARCALRSILDLPRLGVELPPNEAWVYETERFDRVTGGRVHQEDFCQILNVYGWRREKYKAANVETVANLVHRLCPPEDLDELVRRLVFNALAGNEDAHLKNWALTYPDGIQARLSPAYDLVATRLYLQSPGLGLNLNGTTAYEGFTEAALQRLARKVGASESHIVDVARSAVQRTIDAWNETRDELPWRAGDHDAIEGHWASVPLAAG